jgi:hypothetical protein
MSDSNRRESPRFSTGLDSRLGFSPTRIVDISFGGALVETYDWLGVGNSCTLRMADSDVDLSVVVARCHVARMDGARPVYELALSFEAPPSIRRQIAGVVATIGRDRLECAPAW